MKYVIYDLIIEVVKKVFEERVDKIEKVLEKLEEAIIDLTGDISEIKNKINDILIELKMER